jgi:hypothetical protein
MRPEIQYSSFERLLLWVLAVVGLVMINGAFIYGLINREVLQEALANPLTMAFVAESLLLMGVFAYLLTKWGVARLSGWWFVILSLLGSMAFALPVVLLWPRRSAASRRPAAPLRRGVGRP